MELGYANCQRAGAKPVIKHFRLLPTVRTRGTGQTELPPDSRPMPVAMAIYDTEMLSDSPKLHMRKMVGEVSKKFNKIYSHMTLRDLCVCLPSGNGWPHRQPTQFLLGCFGIAR